VRYRKEEAGRPRCLDLRKSGLHGAESGRERARNEAKGATGKDAPG